MIDQKSIAAAYQPLFDLMYKEYGKTLLKSDMDEIIDAVEKVNENLSELWRVKCDIEGCNKTASTQGICYIEAGYICLCSEHSQMAREKEPMPKLKEGVIEREKSRSKNGRLFNEK